MAERVDVDDTKLETWDAHRAKSLCYGRRKAQTTNKQSKQYLELKKGMDAGSTADNFEQSRPRRSHRKRLFEQRSRRRGRGNKREEQRET